MSTWPPIIPPQTRTDNDTQKTNHPADHNNMAGALSQIVGKINDGSLIGPRGPAGPGGPPGPQGQPGGPIPPGGATGQVATKQSAADGDVNRAIEAEVTTVDGHKSLYSDAEYGREEFARLYGGDAYAAAKVAYDPNGRLADLYDKAVMRR